MNLKMEAIRKVYDESPFAFCVMKVVCNKKGEARDLTFTYVNEVCAQLEGQSLNQMIGKNYSELFSERFQKWLPFYADTAISGRTNSFTEYWKMQDKYVKGQCYQLSASYCACLLMDVTEQKKTEEELRVSEEKFQIASQHSDVSFWTYDFQKKMIISTEPFPQKNYDKSIVYDVPDSIIETGYIRSDCVDAYRQMYEQLKKGALTVSGDFWFRKEEGSEDGQWGCEHIVYTNIFDDAGKPVRAIGCAVDLHATKEMERRFRDEVAYLEETQSEQLLAKVMINLSRNRLEKYSA